MYNVYCTIETIEPKDFPLTSVKCTSGRVTSTNDERKGFQAQYSYVSRVEGAAWQRTSDLQICKMRRNGLTIARSVPTCSIIRILSI